MQRGYALGHVDVKFVEINIVAPPGNRLSIGREYNAGDIFHRAGRAMIAGDPLRGREAVFSSLYGQIDLRVIELARRLCEVSRNANGLLGRQICCEQGQRENKRRNEGERRGVRQLRHSAGKDLMWM